MPVVVRVGAFAKNLSVAFIAPIGPENAVSGIEMLATADGYVHV
jgi:hypothetical protein